MPDAKLARVTRKVSPWFHALNSFVFGAAWLGLRLAGGAANAAAAGAPGYFFDHWPAADGLEINSVTAIVQTRDGYLWLGTYNGLMRFDGVRFTVFSSSNTRELHNSRVTALFEDDSGALWIGHETGDLTQYRGGQFHPVHLAFDWVGGPVVAISMDDHGELWLGSSQGGLFRLRDGSSNLNDVPVKGWPIYTIRDRQNRLWVVSNGVVGSIANGVFQTLRFDETTQYTNNYEKVLPSRNAGWWVMRNNQIGKWRDGGWEQPLRPMPWTNDYPTSLLEAPSGALLVGTTKHGLYLFNADLSPRRFTRTEGISSDRVRCLYEDREGNIWIGTGRGLDALRIQKVSMLNPPDHWGGHTVQSFWTKRNGSAWVGTQGAGLYHYQPHHPKKPWTIFQESSGLPSSFVWSVLETQRGELLVGTWGAGLLIQKQGRFEVPAEFSEVTGAVLALYESKLGELWIGTTFGLQRYVSGKLTWAAGKAELGVPDVRAITETPDDTLWFGMSGGGLASLKDGTLKQFRKADGLGSDFVHCLLADADGTLWIGMTDNGLCRMRDGSFATISLDQGLPNSTITQIVDDGTGHLWLGSHRGILRGSKADLHRCADGKSRKVQFLRYGKAEGLASQTCPGGFQPGARMVADGKLWFPTAKGIAIIDPANATTNSVIPPVAIEEFTVEEKPVDQRDVGRGDATGSKITIPPGKQRFEFRYTGLSFAAPDRVRFKYRLEGLEEDWIDAGMRRNVQYTHLSPGTYTFHVIACNNDDVWNESGAALGFVVLPYFWQTWWFRVAAVVAGASTVGGGVLSVMRRRVRRKFEQLEQQRAVERERSRIARDIHDDLGASLTRITMLSQTMRKELAGDSPGARAAAQVNTTSRELTRAMDEIVWAVNPKHDTLDSLATYLGGFAQDFLEAAGIRCRLDVPMQLPPWTLPAELRHNVFLALKEALHNVVKHAGATEVEITLQLSAAGFSLIVSDNGRGFDPRRRRQNAAAPTGDIQWSGGNGLPNIKKRLEEIGGRCDCEASSGHGTKVRLTVPVKTRREP